MIGICKEYKKQEASTPTKVASCYIAIKKSVSSHG